MVKPHGKAVATQQQEATFRMLITNSSAMEPI